MHAITCQRCGKSVIIAGHFGRPPAYCGKECRNAEYAARQRVRRQRHNAEVAHLRERVAALTAAAA